MKTNQILKRVSALFVAVAMILTVVPTALDVAVAEEAGTKILPDFIAPIEVVDTDSPEYADWIAVSDRAGLEAMADNLNGKYYLTNDIDLDGKEWVPLGDEKFSLDSARRGENAFKGIFDGQGYVIRNLTVGNQSFYTGLFGYIESATVKNLGLEDTNINIKDSKSDFTGSVVGYATDSVVSNCYNTGSIAVHTASPTWFASNCVGGIIGYIGGLTDEAEVITDCYNTGSVSATGDDKTIYISGDMSVNAGGLSGSVGKGVISDCFNTGEVSAVGVAVKFKNSAAAGGIAGSSSFVEIKRCYNTGNVTACAVWADSGGIIGEGGWDNPESENKPKKNVTIYDCYNTGKITASAVITGYAAGIFGDVSTSAVSNCYSTGDLYASDDGPYGIYTYYGPLVLAIGLEFRLTNCYWNIDSSQTINGAPQKPKMGSPDCWFENEELATPLTTAQMKQQSSFAGFDFDNVWTIIDGVNDGLPVLRAFGNLDTVGFKAKISSGYGNGSLGSLPVTVISSKSDVVKFFESASDVPHECYNCVYCTLYDYGGDFFDNNYLAVFSFGSPSGDSRYVVERIDNGGNIYVKLTKWGVTDALGINFAVIELDKGFKPDKFNVIFDSDVFWNGEYYKPDIPEKEVDFNAIITTNSMGSYYGDYGVPMSVITSKDELNQFIDDYSPPEHECRYPTPGKCRYGFCNLKLYKDDNFYFNDRYIVAFAFGSPSGSSRYEVDKVDDNGNIYVKLLEWGMTDDIGTVFVVIELDKGFQPDEFNVISDSTIFWYCRECGKPAPLHIFGYCDGCLVESTCWAWGCLCGECFLCKNGYYIPLNPPSENPPTNPPSGDPPTVPPIDPPSGNLLLGDVDLSTVVDIFDALEILKYLVGMESDIQEGNDSWNAAVITGVWGEDAPCIFDALEILKYIANIQSMIRFV